MLQRQIMLKQLQELQRQQQFQELGGDTRQQNYLNQQLSRFNKQTSVSQYPPLINGTPIHDPAQMFMVNNLNLVQRSSTPAVHGFPNAFTFPQAQTQQPDISLYGTPLCGDVHDPSRMFTKIEQEKPIVEERDLFGLVPSQDLKSEVSKHEQGGWPGIFPVKTTTISSSQNVASLDPLEQKILFDDNSWDSSFGMRGNIEAGGFDNINSDNLNSFPSIQSGSWSALMQSAVGEASSSDTGVQEEWSGLSFQNQELSTDNQPSNYIATGKHQSQWVDSKPEAMLNNSNTTFPGFQQPGIEFSLKHKDMSHESTQHSPKHAVSWLEGQRHSPSQSSWPDQNFHQSENSSRLHDLAGDSNYSFQRENSMDSYHSNASQKSAGQTDHDQGYVGQFKNSSISYSSMESDKGRMPNIARNSKESENFLSRSNAESSMPSFFQTPPTSQRTNVNAQTSQNMLELFSKVDKSTNEYKHEMHFGARKSTSSEVPQTESYAKSSASEYFNLNLAPPSPQMTGPNCFGSPQSSPQMGNHGLTFSSGPCMTNQIHNQHLSSTPRVSHRSGERTPGSGSTFPGFSPVVSQEKSDYRQFPFSLTQPNVWRNLSTQHNFSGRESQGIPLDTRSLPDSPNSSQDNARGNLFHAKESAVASASFLSCSQAPEISARDLEVFGRSLKSSHALPQDYPLMQQVQSMKNVPEKYDEVDSTTNVQQVNFSNLASLKSEQSNNNKQMASSWYNHFGTLRNSQTLSMHDGSRAAAFVNATQQLSDEKSLENIAQRNEVGSSQAIWPTTVIPSSAVMIPTVSDQKLEIMKSKKRKYVPVKLLPWHRDVTQGCQSLQDIRFDCSMTDEEWARALNRLVEKVDNNAETIEDSLLIPRPKKRLVRTTMLMQQLFRPAPQIILSENSALSFDKIVYFSARLVLGDACSMTNPISDKSTEEPKPPDEIIEKQKFPEIAEEFTNRTKKLEDEFPRLENSASILDTRIEYQEMERFSIINRFAKFHIRGQVAAAETSTSTSNIPTIPKSFPQRYVTAAPMPSIVPEQGQCISL
jgi:hypothetical protein